MMTPKMGRTRVIKSEHLAEAGCISPLFVRRPSENEVNVMQKPGRSYGSDFATSTSDSEGSKKKADLALRAYLRAPRLIKNPAAKVLFEANQIRAHIENQARDSAEVALLAQKIASHAYLQKIWLMHHADISKIAIKLAEKIVGAQIRINHETLHVMASQVLRDVRLAHAEGDIEMYRIETCFQDAEVVKKHLKEWGLAESNLRVRSDMSPGDLYFYTPKGEFDARIATRLDLFEPMVKEALAYLNSTSEPSLENEDSGPTSPRTPVFVDHLVDQKVFEKVSEK